MNASDEMAKEILRLLVKPTQSSLGVVITSKNLSALSRRGILSFATKNAVGSGTLVWSFVTDIL